MSGYTIDIPEDGLLSKRVSEVLSAAAGSPRRRWSPRMSPTLRLRQSAQDDGQLLPGDGKVMAASSPGSSPRRRWSPRISPNLSRRRQYEPLSPNGDKDNFKENSSPLADFSAENIPAPNFSGTGVLTPRLSNFSLPSPTPRARCQQDRISFGMSSNGGSSRDDSKMEIPSVNPSQLSPIFRFDNKGYVAGSKEAVVTNREKVTGQNVGRNAAHFAKEKEIKDKFAELLKVKRPSTGTNAIKQTLTNLHQICGSLSTLDDLIRAKAFLIANQTDNGRFVNAALKTDFKGRTPLHLFSCNKTLATAIGIPSAFDIETREYLRLYQQSTYDPENLERHAIQFLIGDLLAAYPGAMMIRDDDGFIPFECGLIEWVDLSHNRGNMNHPNETSYLPNLSSYKRAVSQVWGSTSSTLLSAVKLAGRSMIPSETNGGTPSKSPRKNCDVERGDSRNAIFSPNRVENTSSGGEHALKAADNALKDRSFPSHVRLNPHARFSLLMLSAVTDQLDSYMSPDKCRTKTSELGHDMHKESFDETMKTIRKFRNTYGSIDIGSIVIQTGKFHLSVHLKRKGVFLNMISHWIQWHPSLI